LYQDVERRTFGASDLEITPVGIGTAPIGSVPGLWWVNWGPQDEHDSIRAIHAALDAGVNWIDAAPFYGWGRAEEVVGRAIRGRSDVHVFTKCGTMRRDDGDDYMDLSPRAIRADVEGSLRPSPRARCGTAASRTTARTRSSARSPSGPSQGCSTSTTCSGARPRTQFCRSRSRAGSA
jgi:hypothetical protein